MEYPTNLNREELWNKLADWSRQAGRIATRPVLLLWFVMTDRHTPKADKELVLLALSHLVQPIDPPGTKGIPFYQYYCKILSVNDVYKRMGRHVTPQMHGYADALLDKWFPRNKPYITIKG